MPTCTTVAAYLEALPDDRRAVVAHVLDVVRIHLPPGYEEGIQYGMIAWYVPHSRYPAGYHAKPSEPLPFLHLGAQKHHLALYLMGLYVSEPLRAWFEQAWADSGKKLDAGKSCVRFRTVDDLALDVVGELLARLPVDEYVRYVEATRGPQRRKAVATKRTASKPRRST